jgi:hypothetical protein
MAALSRLVIPSFPPSDFLRFYNENIQLIEVSMGILVPLSVLIFLELKAKKKMALAFLFTNETEKLIPVSNDNVQKSLHHFPARILGISILALGILILSLVFTAGEHALLIAFFAGVLILIGAMILMIIRKSKNTSVQLVAKREKLTAIK